MAGHSFLLSDGGISLPGHPVGHHHRPHAQGLPPTVTRTSPLLLRDLHQLARESETEAVLPGLDLSLSRRPSLCPNPRGPPRPSSPHAQRLPRYTTSTSPCCQWQSSPFSSSSLLECTRNESATPTGRSSPPPPLWACCAPHPPQPTQPYGTDPNSSFPQRISYVPHANRALRSMNMHLNMRTISSPWKRLVPFPFSLVFPASSPTPQRTRTSTTTGAPIPLPSIPPTKNPRGELIFSSRVDRPFKDGYERYRALFEKRRAERYHQLRASQTGLRGLWWRLLGYRRKKVDATTTGSDAAGGRTSQRSSRTPSPSPSAVLAGATAAGAVGGVEAGSSIGTPPLSTPKSMDAPVNP